MEGANLGKEGRIQSGGAILTPAYGRDYTSRARSRKNASPVGQECRAQPPQYRRSRPESGRKTPPQLRHQLCI